MFHSSAWARVLADTYRYRPFYFASDVPGDATPAILCSFQVDSWLTGRRGITLPFTDECRLLPGQTTGSVGLFQHVLDLGRIHGWRSFELRGCEAAPETKPSLSFYSHSLALGRSSDDLFQRFDSSARRAIRKAERSALRGEVATTLQAVREYYRLHCLTRLKHGLPPQPFAFFANIHEHLIRNSLGFVAVAYLGEQPVAAALFLHWHGRAHYKFGASDPRFDHLRPSNFVMWNAIKHCVALRLLELDFGRTSLHNEGLRKYKQTWGTHETLLHYGKWDFARSEFVQDIDRSSGFKNKVFRRLPLSLNRLLGRVLYPHIA